MTLFTALAATVAILNATANSVTDCSKGTSVFKFTGGSLLPDPVVPGQDSSITLNAEIPAGTNINAGTAKYSFSFNGIPFSPTTEDLCSDVACPLLAGPYTNTTTSVFPSGVSGKVVTRIEWFDTANNRLLCADVTAKI
jgi:ML domain